MKYNVIVSVIIAILAWAFSGCTSLVKVPPYPTGTAWSSEVKRLGVVTADSGRWPLSLHSVPSDYTFQAALRSKAAAQFGVPETEIVLGEASVKVGAELDGTIRDWKATAEAGQLKNVGAVAKSPSDGLLEVKKLLDAGAITQAEFDAKKKILMERL
jgi:hypothetical protein